MDQTMHKISVSPCKDEVKIFSSSLNLTIPIVYTPLERLSVTITEIILSHELNTLKRPYSAEERSLVKIGVVKTVIPFCNTAAIRNQKEALNCTLSEFYLFIKL